jgi:hypothetical protein
MGINIAKLAERLKQFEDGKNKNELSKLLWKPKEGQTKIRIVPYKFNTESPFIELKFYYGIAGKHYLAPCTFGKPDPIMEFIETLRNSGSNEEKILAKKLFPTSRTYAPIIVRGEEDAGVKFWGFGVTVYKQLLELLTNPEWGDITNPTEGNDITITFKKEGKKKGPDGKAFPETSITPSPKKTPCVDMTKKDLLEKVKNQTNILEIFPLPTYDDLKVAMHKFLNPEEDTTSGDGAEDPTPAADASSETTTEASSAPATPTQTAPASTTPAPAGDLANAFEKFFNT